MRRTGTFFQLARGRAMVRNRAMRSARAIKRRLTSPLDPHGMPWRERAREHMIRQIGYEVQRARAAHRQWRHYRAMSAMLGDAD